MTVLIRIIDIESTGLDPALDRIVEVATVDLHVDTSPLHESGDADPGKVTPKITRGRMWSSLVNPERPIPPEASAVHDITDEMVQHAPKLAELLPAIKYVDGGCDVGEQGPTPNYWCAHHSRFDQQFIDPVAGTVWLDTYRIALWLWPDAPSHKNAVLRYWLGVKVDLTVAAQPDMRSHRALWDAYITGCILRRALMCGATLDDMVEVSTQPARLKRLGFGKHATDLVTDIPTSYLEWVLKNITDDEDVRHTAFMELSRRRNEGA